MSLLFEKVVPGATTSIVIGRVQEPARLDLTRYRAVLWCVDPRGTTPRPAGVPGDGLEVVTLDYDSSSTFPGRLEEFLRRDPKRLPSVFITRQLSGPHADAYQAIIDEVYRQLESTHRARTTRQLDGFTWQKHILANAAAYVARRLPDGWAGALAGVPAVVCGAGPSLDVSGSKLATAATSAVVFAADSALRALARHGVRADFAVSIDAAKVPEKCLPAGHGGMTSTDPRLDVRNTNIGLPARVMLASVSPPSWQTAVPTETQFYLSGRQLTDDWFASLGVPRTTVDAIESCGSTAIELAIHLGCDPIYLFGLDLAVDPANQAKRHQQDADPGLYAQSHYDPTATLPRVPGNYADTVPCFALADWRALDERLASRSTPQVFNVSDRGARLRGTTLVHPDQFAPAVLAANKATQLAKLASCGRQTSDAGATALERLRKLGERCSAKLPAMRQALKKGPAELAQHFRAVLVDPDCGRAFGGFSLKVMPHLFPPIEGDRVFWQGLVDEFGELAELAARAGTEITQR